MKIYRVHHSDDYLYYCLANSLIEVVSHINSFNGLSTIKKIELVCEERTESMLNPELIIIKATEGQTVGNGE